MEVQLISAIREGDVPTLKELLADPANEGYTYTFMGGATPLHWAAQEGQHEALSLFLERKTNPVDAKDCTGATALHWAADEGQVESMRLLLAKGASVDAADHEGETPLIRAALVGHVDALTFLLKSHANINAMSTTGSALHAAVINNNGDCIKALIKADADPHLPNKEGQSALQMAEAKSPQLKTFFDKNTNALRDEVDELRAQLEEWKTRALEAESKYETSQKKLMQVYNELKDAQDGLKEERDRASGLESQVADAEQRAAEATRQLAAVQEANETELQKLRLECEKPKPSGESEGDLFKMSQDVMKLREKLQNSENTVGQLASQLTHAKIEAEVESKLRKQTEEKNRRMRTELQKLRLERGDNRLSFGTSEKALRQVEVIRRSFSSLQEVLRIAEKSIGHTTVQLDAFKLIVDQNKEGDKDDDDADEDQGELQQQAASGSSPQPQETAAVNVVDSTSSTGTATTPTTEEAPKQQQQQLDEEEQKEGAPSETKEGDTHEPTPPRPAPEADSSTEAPATDSA